MTYEEKGRKRTFLLPAASVFLLWQIRVSSAGALF